MLTYLGLKEPWCSRGNKKAEMIGSDLPQTAAEPQKDSTTELLEFLEAMLIQYLAGTKGPIFFVAKYNVMTNAFKAEFVMRKTSSKPSVGAMTSSMYRSLYLPLVRTSSQKTLMITEL